MAIVKCSNCGKAVSTRSLNCPACGTVINSQAQSGRDTRNKSRKMTLAEACAIFILTPLTVAVFKYAKPPEQPQVVAEAVQPPDASPEPVATPEPTPTQQEPAETVEEAPASETHANCNTAHISCTAYKLSREVGVSEDSANVFFTGDELDLETIASNMCYYLNDDRYLDTSLQEIKDNLQLSGVSSLEAQLMKDAMLAVAVDRECPWLKRNLRWKIRDEQGK